MTAPTEAEIRDLVQQRIQRHPRDNGRHSLTEAVDKAFDTIGYIKLDARDRHAFAAVALSDTWADLSKAEITELHDLIVEGHAAAMDAAWAAIVDQVVEAGLAFGSRHPEARRARREPVPA